MSHTRTSWIILVALLPAFGGCVSQAQLDRYRNLYRTSQGQVIDLKGQIESLQATIRSLQNAPRAQDPETLRQLEALKAERDAMIAQLDALEQQIMDASKRPLDLPAGVDEALQRLAAQHGDVMEYRAEAGMIRMRSDLTFTSGSATVNDRARQSLADLAVILKVVVAQGYEARIVGHTDNQPIVRVRVQHPTNWHLSVHRAVAVRAVLEEAGLPAASSSVAGYGEYRPIAPNGAQGNQANRRVEIYIVAAKTAPAATVAPAPAAPPIAAPPPAPPAPREEPMK